MDIDATTLTGPLDGLLGPFLQRQSWYGATDHLLRSAEVSRIDVWREEWPVLAWALVDVRYEGGAGARYQVFIGGRLAGDDTVPLGSPRATLGEFETESGPAILYDALTDPDLATLVAQRLSPEIDVGSVRLLDPHEDPNTSVVLDETHLLKVFRRVHSGPNPDVEMSEALAGVGFEQLSVPRVRWNSEGVDLAVVRDLPRDGASGRTVAARSLRDLYGNRLRPSEDSGDFASDSRRLGQMTGRMHVASAEAFGVESADADAWADSMIERLKLIASDALDFQRIEAAYDRFRAADDLGASIRVHGDYRLARTMRTAEQWLVLDFEGERGGALERRRRRWSPLRDIASMIRSFATVTKNALSELRQPVDPELAVLGDAWLERNTQAFIDGYVSTEGVPALLPSSPETRDALLTVHELDKAIYDVGYELAHRPQSVDIPLEAVNRLLGPAG